MFYLLAAKELTKVSSLVLVILSLGQCHHYNPYHYGWDGRVYNESGWGYRYLYGHGYYPSWAVGPSLYYYPLYSPWNEAVATMRTSRSRDRVISSEAVQSIRQARNEVSELYAQLKAARKEDKKELREAWIDARKRLEKECSKVIKERN